MKIYFIYQDPAHLDWVKPYFLRGIRQHHISTIIKPDIIDNDFKNPDLADYRKLLDYYNPPAAIAPDIFTEADLMNALQLIKDYSLNPVHISSEI